MLTLIRKKREMLGKILRLSAFVFFAQVLVAALLVRGVRAQLKDLMRSTGAKVTQLGAKAEEGGPPRTLHLNGAEVRLRAQRVYGRTLDEVLDQAEAHCRSTNGRFYEQLREGAHTKLLAEAQLSVLDGVIRDDGNDMGQVACLEVGDEKSSPVSMLERAQNFVKTGDIASFGDLRYVRAEKRENGVFVVMMWTDGPLNVKRMFPRSGDAPGVDFPDLPRHPTARRILSAWEEGQSPSVNIYETTAANAAELDDYYRSELVKLGWDALTPASKDRSARAHALVVMRDGVTVTLSQTSVDGGKHTTTTIMPMDTAGSVDVAAR